MLGCLAEAAFPHREYLCRISSPIQPYHLLPFTSFPLPEPPSSCGTWTHLLTSMATVSNCKEVFLWVCPIPFFFPPSVTQFPVCMCVHACACACACVWVCVSCVLHLTTFEFKLYKIYDAKHFHTTENWGFPLFFFVHGFCWFWVSLGVRLESIDDSVAAAATKCR